MIWVVDNRERTIGFIGIGVLGRGLALSLIAQGYRVIGAQSRTRSSALWLGERIPQCQVFDSAQDLADAADLIFITTPDSVIPEVAASITWRPGQGAVHCSGALSTAVLDCASQQGADIGSFHPFQTFAGVIDAADTVSRLSGVTFAVSGTGWLEPLLTDLAHDLGGRVVSIPDEDRPAYHASAVLSCGYLLALLQSAVSLWETFGVDPGDAMKAIYPLARATLENLAAHGAESSVTGPVVRGDAATIQSHLELLSQKAPDSLPVYLALTRSSFPLATRRGVSRSQLATMQELIDQYDRRSGACRG